MKTQNLDGLLVLDQKISWPFFLMCHRLRSVDPSSPVELDSLTKFSLPLPCMVEMESLPLGLSAVNVPKATQASSVRNAREGVTMKTMEERLPVVFPVTAMDIPTTVMKNPESVTVHTIPVEKTVRCVLMVSMETPFSEIQMIVSNVPVHM